MNSRHSSASFAANTTVPLAHWINDQHVNSAAVRSHCNNVGRGLPASGIQDSVGLHFMHRFADIAGSTNETGRNQESITSSVAISAHGNDSGRIRPSSNRCRTVNSVGRLCDTGVLYGRNTPGGRTAHCFFKVGRIVNNGNGINRGNCGTGLRFRDLNSPTELRPIGQNNFSNNGTEPVIKNEEINQSDNFNAIANNMDAPTGYPDAPVITSNNAQLVPAPRDPQNNWQQAHPDYISSAQWPPRVANFFNAMTQFYDADGSLNTRILGTYVIKELKRLEVSQCLFGKTLLHRSKKFTNKMLNKPTPWKAMRGMASRMSFERMLRWAVQDDDQKRAILHMDSVAYCASIGLPPPIPPRRLLEFN